MAIHLRVWKVDGAIMEAAFSVFIEEYGTISVGTKMESHNYALTLRNEDDIERAVFELSHEEVETLIQALQNALDWEQ